MLFRYLKTSGNNYKRRKTEEAGKERHATVNSFSALTGADCGSGEWESLYQRCCSSGVCVLGFSTCNSHFPRAPPDCPLLGLKPCRERSRRPSASGEMKKHPTVYISALSGTLWPCSPPASKGAAPCCPVALEPPTIVSRLFVLSNLLTLPTRQHPQR